MRHRRSLVLLLAASAAFAGLSSACGGVAGSGGGSSQSGSVQTTSSGRAGTGDAATTTGSGTGGAPGTGSTATSGGSGGTRGTGGGAGGAPESTVTLHPDAPPLPGQSGCTVVEVSNIPEPDFVHEPLCTAVTYATNPPSGGNHWPVWAAYTQYTAPVPRELYVHDLEHGAIVLTYNCADACPDVVSALAMAFASEVDPLCLSMGGGPIARMVLTPDPLLSTPIAASAWGATYTATCIDMPSLLQFVRDHYGYGREALCTDGVAPQSLGCTDAGG